MALEFTDRITLPPCHCLLCGSTPQDDTKPGRPILPMAHCVGMDVNWGESVYICVNCIGVMADFIGRVDAEKHKVLLEEFEHLQLEHDTLSKKYDKQRGRLNRIIEGAKARKEQLAA